MKILELHEITERHLSEDYSSYDVITFDDGMYSQYYYREFYLSLKKPLIYFISSGIIHTGLEQSKDIDCVTAHKNYFNNNDTSSYMTLEQIKELSVVSEIGGHGHHHTHLSGLSLKEMFNKFKIDTEIMINYFENNNIKIKSYCYPYNFVPPFGNAFLKSKDIQNIYGTGRCTLNF
jgi:peptidoglycan/xylan/chitin deacetylase (PgdA/CDA1 family)